MMRSKYESVIEDFPFLKKVVSEEVLRGLIEQQMFHVRRLRFDSLFRETNSSYERFVIWTFEGEEHVEKLTEGELWATFPYRLDPRGAFREFVAIVHLYL